MICLSISGISSKLCPRYKDNHFEPCSCETVWGKTTIYCGGTGNLVLELFFQKLHRNLKDHEKSFDRFYLNNTAIEKLESDTFKEILFDEIYIEKCNNLAKINRLTFPKGIKKIEFYRNPKLSSLDNNFFKDLASYTDLEVLNFNQINIKEIPSKPFYTDNTLTSLYYIEFIGKSFEKLGSNVFSEMSKLEEIVFDSTSIDFIPNNAFAMNNSEHERNLTITFSNNRLLNASSFSPYFLNNTNPRVRLNLDLDDFAYLDENIFHPFLMEYPIGYRTINFYSAKFDCTHCRNAWLRKYPDVLSQIENLRCSNGNRLEDEDNFKKMLNKKEFVINFEFIHSF